MLLGILQALICCVGDLVLGIQCLDPRAFVFAGIVESFVYVNIIYAFSIAFKHIGKALCVLLVILQIPGSSGTYPIEMMPSFFQAIHPWLPFTYGINAMREAIAGYYGDYYVHNLLMLLLFVVPALLIGVGWRRHLLNINVLFDKRLAQTDLMICEKNGIVVEHYKISSVIRSLLHDDTYRDEITARAAHFEHIYPKIIRWGFIALLALPIGLTAVMFTASNKSLWFVIWIVCLVALCAMLIIIEYLHESMRRQAEFAGLSQDEMYQVLGEKLDKEYYDTPLRRLRQRMGSVQSDVHAALAKTSQPEDVLQIQRAGVPVAPDETTDTAGITTIHLGPLSAKDERPGARDDKKKAKKGKKGKGKPSKKKHGEKKHASKKGEDRR